MFFSHLQIYVQRNVHSLALGDHDDVKFWLLTDNDYNAPFIHLFSQELEHFQIREVLRCKIML